MSVIRLRSAKGRARPGFVPPPEEGQVRALREHRRLAVTGGLVGLVVGAVAFLPASLVAGAVASATGQRFLLAEADGTVWNGSALPVLAGGAGSRDASVLPSRLAWRLRPRWNGLALQLTQDCCLPHGIEIGIHRKLSAWQVTVDGPGDRAAVVVPKGGASAALAQAQAGAAAPIGQFPAAWLEGSGFPFNTVHPGGLLTLSTHELAFAYQGGRWRTQGSAQLELRQASSRLSTLDTLGSYLIALDADPTTEATPGLGAERMRITLSTIEGALIADGTGQIGPNGAFRFRGQAKAAPGAEPALNNLLNLIGRRSGALSVISIG
jgi:general secretion pathway protein N